ncbi:MAG: 50S ribosomal protein L10 [Candidatus Omnitrophica bacterium]|nr:50S ribosomal protein L10 [Candidatus Omnitrophota bacterium]MCF7893483.1 50S ribosomal protein L10 [Candidatus Omnitrophota bacterium]
MEAKTIGIAIRENIIKKVQERVSSSSVYFFIGFNKVKASALSDLRNQLRVVDSYVFVAKNSLINKALEDAELENLKDYFQGETGIISVYNEDIVKPCKVIVDFSKENESFAIKGGIIEGRKITKEELESLAKLPGREVLLAQAVSGLAAPITGFVACLNQIILKFAWVIEEIKKVQSQKSKAQSQDKDKEKSQEEKAATTETGKDKGTEKKAEKQEGKDKGSRLKGKEKEEEEKAEDKTKEENKKEEGKKEAKEEDKTREEKVEEKSSEEKPKEEQEDKKEDKSKESKENKEEKEK